MGTGVPSWGPSTRLIARRFRPMIGSVLRRSAIPTILFLASCSVGSVLNNNSGDGGGGGSGDGGSPGTGSNCPALQDVSSYTGHHPSNGTAGDPNATVIQPHEGCMGQSGCHNGALSPESQSDIWIYGGEAFQDTAGTTPYAGGTILLGTADGTQFTQLTIAQNGFFYLPMTSPFPAPGGSEAVDAWICVGTNKVEMSSTIVAGDGNCTTSACHGPGAPDGFINLQPAN